MKKLTKKIYLSIVSIFIALIALGTSTYAWFSMGTGAQANGMEVRAKADSVFLKIAKENSSDAVWGINVKYTASDAQQLLPIAHEGSAGSYSWYYGYSETKSSATIKSGSKRTVSSESVLDEKYRYHKTVYLKTGTENDAKVLYVSSVSLTDAGNSISNSLRVLVKCGDVYHEYNYSEIKSGLTATLSGGQLTSDSVTKFKLADEVTSTAVAVDIYIFFDGDDAQVMSSNANALTSDIKVDISFAVEGTK